MEEETKKTTEEELTETDVMKKMKLSLLEKMVKGGGMNENEVVALSKIMEKEQPESLAETMKEMQMMKMMNPQQDSMSQMLPLMMMMGMNNGGDSKLEKKIDALEKQIMENREEKRFSEIMREIKEIRDSKNNKDQFGTKEFLTMLLSKDDKMAEMWRQMSDKDREASQKQIDTIMKMKSNDGMGLGGLGEKIQQLKGLTESLGFNKVKEQSNPEIIKDLIGGVTGALTQSPGFNDALSGLGTKFANESKDKISQMQAARNNPRNSAPIISEPAPATPAPTIQPNQPNQYSSDTHIPIQAPIMEGGKEVYPDLVKEMTNEVRDGKKK